MCGVGTAEMFKVGTAEMCRVGTAEMCRVGTAEMCRVDTAEMYPWWEPRNTLRHQLSGPGCFSITNIN
jgi:hypothetical protein